MNRKKKVRTLIFTCASLTLLLGNIVYFSNHMEGLKAAPAVSQDASQKDSKKQTAEKELKTYTDSLQQITELPIAVEMYGNLLKNTEFGSLDGVGIPANWNFSDYYPDTSVGGSQVVGQAYNSSVYASNSGTSYTTVYWNFPSDASDAVILGQAQGLGGMGYAMMLQQVAAGDLQLGNNILFGADVVPYKPLGIGPYGNPGLTNIQLRLFPGDIISGPNALTFGANDTTYYDQTTNRFSVDTKLNDEQQSLFAQKGLRFVLAAIQSGGTQFSNVYLVQSGIDASAVQPITVPVGTKLADVEGQLQTAIGAVQVWDYDSKTYVTADSYTIDSIVEGYTPDMATVGAKSIKVNVTATAGTITGKGMVEVPVNVEWGNTVSVDGTDGQTSMAFTLVPQATGDYQLMANFGDNQAYQTAEAVAPSVGSEVYYQVDLFANDQDDPVLRQDLSYTGKATVKVLGNDTASAKINNWGASGAASVEAGDMLRVYVEDTSKERFYLNNTQGDYAGTATTPSTLPNGQWLFYQVIQSDTGTLSLEPVYLNQLNGRENVQIDKNTPTWALNLQELEQYTSQVADTSYYQGIFFSMGEFEAGSPETNTEGSDIPGVLKNIGAEFGRWQISFDVPVTFQVTADEFVAPWLSDYENWKDPSKEMVPKENTFSLMYTDQTKVIASSENMDTTTGIFGQFKLEGESAWVSLSNVGYYQGKQIGLKVTISSQTFQEGTTNQLIVLDNSMESMGYGFLEVIIGAGTMIPEITVKYDFLEQDDSGAWIPATDDIGGYLTFDLNETGDKVSLSQQADGTYPTVFSSSHEAATDPTQLVYGLSNSQLVVQNSDPDVSNLPVEQKTFTSLYKGKSFEFTLGRTDSSQQFTFKPTYETYSGLRLAIPDPEQNPQKYNQITQDNRTSLSYQFVQQIPYEPADGYNQTMTWTVEGIASIADSSISQTDTWEIYDETGAAVADGLFTITPGSNDQTTITANITNADLYNHYYLFERKLTFSGQEVNPANLSSDTYFDSEGTQQTGDFLKINGGSAALQVVDQKNTTTLPLATVPNIFQTQINYTAQVTYNYLIGEVDEDEQVPYNDPTVETTYLTYPYPIQEAPEISGYTYANQSTPSIEDLKDPIQYSSNQVDFYYTLTNPDGLPYFWKTPSDMKFKNQTIESKIMQIPLADPNYSIGVVNPKTEAVGWTLSAALTKPFATDEGKALSGAVINYKVAGSEFPVSDSQAVPLTQETTAAGEKTEVTFNDTTDTILLSVPPQSLQAGKTYQAEVTYTLTNAPTTAEGGG